MMVNNAAIITDTPILEISEEEIDRISRVAFESARRRRNHVTHVHKANVLRLTDGLFRTTVLATATDFPEIEVEEQLVDSMSGREVICGVVHEEEQNDAECNESTDKYHFDRGPSALSVRGKKSGR